MPINKRLSPLLVVLAVIAATALLADDASAETVSLARIIQVNEDPVRSYEAPESGAAFREIPKSHFESAGHLQLIRTLPNGWIEFIEPGSGMSAYLHPLAMRIQNTDRSIRCERRGTKSTRVNSVRNISTFNCGSR